MSSISRRLTAEALGSAMLLAIVVGSGIMAEQLAAGNTAVALLANTLATGTGLVVLILMFGPLSGAHFNPVVTLAMAWQAELPWRDVPGYLVAQLIGAMLGVLAAHLMFELPLVSWSQHVRSGPSQWFSEAFATFGLLLTIIACSRQRPAVTPFAVGAYISSAYWFTASTSFANPAVTLARSLSDSFAGIRPVDVPSFMLAQGLGMVVAVLLARWLWQSGPAPTADQT